MDKRDKQLAVELACAVINSMKIVKPITGDDVNSILEDCYSAVTSLEDFDDGI